MALRDEKARPLLHIVGRCEARLFGLSPAERLRRQRGPAQGPVLVAHASAVLGDAAVGWLLENPGTMLTGPSGRPLAIAVDPEQASSAEKALLGEPSSFASADPARMGEQFIRKLRRRDLLFARSIADEPAAQVERELFANVYKGVTDLVTKWVWPVPALWATRIAAWLGMTPNMVTGAGLVLTFVAAWLFYHGDLAAGLAAAWAMTFLDTVDGKLARVTVTSSPLGNLLDHVTDYVHPPIWWFCLAWGIAGPVGSGPVWTSCWVILGCYVAGRAIEELFKLRIGFNQYLWHRFDSGFRLIVSRRNVILLFMTAGLIAGAPAGAFLLCALWSAASVAIQAIRLGQALSAARRGPVTSWLM